MQEPPDNASGNAYRNGWRRAAGATRFWHDWFCEHYWTQLGPVSSGAQLGHSTVTPCVNPHMKIIIAFLAITLLSVPLWAENSVALKQKTVPLTITKYEATFQTAGQFDSRHPDQISHKAAYMNTSRKVVVAVQIRFAAFDAFNSFMGSFSGWSIETLVSDAEATGEWLQRPYAAFSFKKYGTGVAYVNAVRFSDGTIWRADMAEVLAEMQKFEKDLKKEDLEEKKK